MLGHLGIKLPAVPDLVAAKVYDDQIMPLLGLETFVARDDEFAYRPADGKRGTYLFFYAVQAEDASSRDATGLQHLAFMVGSHSAVRDVHDLVVRLGDEVLHPPQTFPQYPPPYYAKFWVDPHGFMLEAVCHHDRD